MLNQLDLELSDLKAFSSDGASVMTGVDGGVAAKLRRMDDCKTMINVHCVCHRLALACSDMGDELQFVKDFELTMIQLWKFFKDSPKRLRTNIRVGMQLKNFDAMSKRQKRKVVLRVRKACRTMWLSLHASVNAVFEEFGGLLQVLRVLSEDKSAGQLASGILKKMENIRFLGTLYLMKFTLPNLSTLSKLFQTGGLNFSRIIPCLEKAKSKIMSVANENQAFKELEEDLAERLRLCDIELTDFMKQSIKRDIRRYAVSISENIDARFPNNAQRILDAFSIFNFDTLPTNSSTCNFVLYGEYKIETLHDQFFPDDDFDVTNPSRMMLNMKCYN